MKKIFFLIQIFFLYSFNHSPNTTNSQRNSHGFDERQEPFHLKDISLSWIGSLGFDILGTAQLRVRTTFTVRWTRKNFEFTEQIKEAQ